MARWEGNPVGRLEQAALSLFLEQGYDRTTVAQIAKRAGLGERSFYRHFTDKREVLFGGGYELEKVLVAAIEAVPPGLAALPTLIAAFPATREVIRPRELLHDRAKVIAANPPLQERELIKVAMLSAAVTDALIRRGDDRVTAQLATDLGMATLRVASSLWLAGDDSDFTDLLTAAAAQVAGIANQLSKPAPPARGRAGTSA
jgi:AcrR family transcriptional regulator